VVADPAPGVLEAIRDAETVFLAPSNPFVSIQPILAVPGVSEVVAGHDRVVAISPIVGGRALRGPLAGMLASLGHEASAVGVAQLYAGLASAFVLDPEDAALQPEIEALGLRAIVAPIVMADPATRADVGRAILDAL
jgi:LPPG:FO 2-phospho-L-lactate transferase